MKDLLQQEEFVQSEDNSSTTPSTSFDNQEEAPEPDKWGAVQSALVQESVVGSLTNHAITAFISSGYEEDPEFKEHIVEKAKELENYSFSYETKEKILDSAKSDEHFYRLVLEAEREQKNAEALDNLGVEGVLYRVAAGLSDIASTGGLFSAVPKISMKLLQLGEQGLMRFGLSSKTSSVIAKMTGGVGVEVGLEIPKQENLVNNRDELDMAISVVAGGIGGAMFKTAELPEETITTIKEALNEGIEDTIKPVKEVVEKHQNLFIDTMEKFQIDQISVFANSKSPTLKAFLEPTEERASLLYNPRFKNVDNRAASEYNYQYIKKVEALKQQAYFPLIKKYKELMTNMPNIPGLNRFMFNTTNDFYEYCGKVTRGFIDESELPKEVLDFHDEIRRANKTLAEGTYDMNVANGHPLYVSETIKRDPTYLPIHYKTTKIMSDILAGKLTPDDYTNLIMEGLKNSTKNIGREIPEETLRLRADEWVKKQLKRHELQKKGDLHSLVQADARLDDFENLVNTLVNEYKVDVSDATAMAKDTLKKSKEGAKPISARSRQRSGIDLTATITTAKGEVISLADYVENNIDLLWKNYGESMGGDIALQKAGFKTRVDILEHRKIIEKELDEAIAKGEISETTKIKDLATYDDIMKQFLGYPTVKDPDGAINRGVELMNSLSRYSKLMGTWAKMLPEVAATAHASGVSNLVKHVFKLPDFIRGYKGITKDELMLEARIHGGIGVDAYRMPNNFMYDSDHILNTDITKQAMSGEDIITQGTNRLLSGAKRLEEGTLQIGGVKPLTAFLQRAFYSGVGSKIVKGVVKKGKIPEEIAKECGWSKEIADKIAQQITTHGDLKGTSVNVFNFKDWEAGVSDEYFLGIQRYSSNYIQESFIGDRVAFASKDTIFKNTWFGKMSLNLMDYTMTAYSKQLSRSLYNFDKHQLTKNIWLTGGSIASAYLSTYLKYADYPEKLQEELKPDKVARKTFTLHPMMAFVPQVADLVSRGLTGENLDGYTPRGSSLVPSGYDTASTLLNTGKVAYGLMSDEAEVNRREVLQLLNTIFPPLLGIYGLNRKIADDLTYEESVTTVKPEKDFDKIVDY